MRFFFDTRKAAQAASYLLSLAGGTMGYIVLIKLLYLSDRRALIETGSPITGDRMVSMPHGPVLSQTYDIITTGEPVPPQAPIAWYEYVTEPHDKYSVSAKKANAEIDELSRYELEILGQTFAQFGKMGKWPLVDLTHTLPEWSDPQGSSRPINPEDILRAAGKSDAQIEEWTEMAEEVWFLRNLPSITH